MTKVIKVFIFLFGFIFAVIFYLGFVGIETNKFNQLIKNKITEINDKVSIELRDVKIVLNIKNFTIDIKTYGPDLFFKNKKIKLEKISTSFAISSFVSKDFAIKKLAISTKKNDLKDIIYFARAYKNSPELFILNKILKDGDVIADININFNDKGEVKENFNIKGFVKNAKINLLNKQVIDQIEFDFVIKNKLSIFKNTKFEFNKLKLLSKEIVIANKDKFFLVNGDIKNSLGKISPEILSFYFKNNFENLGFSDLNLSSENIISFKISKKLKFSDFKINSKIFLKNVKYIKKIDSLKNYLPSFDNYLELHDHIINLEIDKNKSLITGKGKFLLNENYDEVDYSLAFKNKNYLVKSKINLKKNPLIFKLLNYKKNKDKDSILDVEFFIKNNNLLKFKKILFKESQNKLLINDLNFDKNFKIINISNLDLDFLNENKIQNNVLIKKDKQNYEIIAKNLDAKNIIDAILDSKNDNKSFSIFSDFSSKIKINIAKTYLDNINYINKLNGDIEFSKNKLINLKLNSKFSNDKQINLTVKINENNEKITTLFSDMAKPLVKRYKFIKGFEGGKLDFYSVKKNNKSKSQIKIYNFKLNELPALTKILTLASLQGIADLLTGEGIRFNEFEMNFSNQNNHMQIDEIYAIGPAISILMNGYIDQNDLVSLRGTLVPATTLNKVLGSIPVLGNILVGKKTGEGVFGVSFKIKGKQKNLKTTVNPVKTLTPRFITRTLEKIKKAN